MKRKLLAMMALAAAVGLPGHANPVEYQIPATQAEFEQQWTIIPGTEEGTWTWVDGSTPYAYTVPFAATASASNGKIGSTLVYAEPFEMKAGESYYLQANVSSANFNDDTRFYIVFGTDINNLNYIAEDSNAFYVYNTSFQYKPTDTNKENFKVTVSEDGTYYVGVRSWYAAGTYPDKQLRFEGFKMEKDVAYPNKVSSATATADQTGAMEATLTWTWPSTDKNDKALSGSLGANIYRYNSNSKTELYKAENIIATINDGLPGETATYTDKTIPAPGKYYYYIAPFNDEGENSGVAPIITLPWVGEDEKALNPLNLVLSLDDEEGLKVKLTWEARIKGYNDGVLIPENLSYTITRSKDGGEYVTIAEGYKGNIPYADHTGSEYPIETYVDENLDGPGIYSYKVYLDYKGVLSNASTTKYGSPDKIFAGGSFSVPFSSTFDSSSSTDMWTITPNSYSGKWQFNSSYKCLYLSGGTYYKYSSYLITPGLKLEAGKTYRISCSSWVSILNTDDEPSTSIAITVGKESSDTSMTTLFTTNINVKQDDKASSEAYFSPTETGVYYIGFNGSINYMSHILYLDDVMIEESVLAPATVADLVSTPDNAGANSATVSFTIPDKSNAGAELSEITKVVVSRTDGEGEVTVVKTITGEDATPGKQVSFVDEVPQAGMYSYTVVSTLDEVESKPATTDAAWIGYDMPKTPTSSPSCSKNEDGTIKISWYAPGTYTVLGEHNGFVDRENLIYGVYRISPFSQDDIVKIGQTTETKFTDDISDVEWGKYSYAISYINGPNESGLKQGGTATGGKIASWPYKPDLSDEKYFGSLETHGCTYNNGAYFGNIVTSFDERSVYFPPFDVNDSEKLNYKLNLQVSKVKEESQESLEVYLCTLDAPATYDVRKVIKAAPFAGENNKTLVQGITVNALTDAPENKEVAVKIPQTGRYRVALKLTSPDTQGLRIHALTLATDTSTGVDELGDAGNAIAVRGGELLLPENTTAVCVYALDGMMVVKAGAVTTLDLSDLARGLYMVRVETADNNTLTAKIRN